MLELRHLRTLTALQETGSVSLAAKRVHLTQSALSHQIKALQDYYQLPLIQRQGHAIQLTDAGKRLVRLAEKVIMEVQVAERDLARLSQRTTGNLRIALECHTCFDWLMPIIWCPDFTLTLSSCSNRERRILSLAQKINFSEVSFIIHCFASRFWQYLRQVMS
jgi:molybdate transport repressor ModE-like protein